MAPAEVDVNWVGFAALLGWVPLTLLLYAMLPPRRAALTALLLGHLFLPQGGVDLPGMLDVTRTTVVGVGVLLGILLFDSGRLQGVRWSRYDLLMIVWCLVPFASSLSNDLGVYDGLSSSATSVFTYGAPYLVGRAYVRDLDDFGALSRAILVGGLVYVPLCWFEIRMSPQLHHVVYGFTQHVFEQTRRFGGWRPMVFLQHGTATSLWMGAATLIAFGLWRAGRLTWFARSPGWLAVVVLAVTVLFCKSTGAIVLTIVAGGAVFASRSALPRAPFLVLALVVPAFLVARVGFSWRPDALVEEAEQFDVGRAASLETRIAADNALVENAKARPWFGWGGWSRHRARVDLTDSLWGITVAQRGFVGLVSLFGVFVVAQLLPLRRLRRSSRFPSEYPDIMVLVVVVSIYALDSLVNAHACPLFVAAAGALIGWGARADGGGRLGRSP